MSTLRIADFALSPGGRFVSDGEYSGEWFRNEILAPAIRRAMDANDKLHVLLVGTSGYGSSFLEEAFGGLIRRRMFQRNLLEKVLIIDAGASLYEPYKLLVEKYLATAKPETVAA